MPIGLGTTPKITTVSQVQPEDISLAVRTGRPAIPPVIQNHDPAKPGTGSSVFAEAADRTGSSSSMSGFPIKGQVIATPADWFVGLMKNPSSQRHDRKSGGLKYSFSTTELGRSQLFTDGTSNAKTLVISAHGSYARKSGSVRVPENTRFEMLNPHGTYLADPKIGNIASGARKIYATVDQDGVRPETKEAKQLLDEKGFKALTGSHKQGMVRNYDLSPYEDDSFDVVGQAIDSNRLYAAGGIGAKADFLILKENASLEEVLEELEAKGIHYENIDLGFCRGSDSLFKRSHTFDPKDAARLAEPSTRTVAPAMTSNLPDHQLKRAPTSDSYEHINRLRTEEHAHGLVRQERAVGLPHNDSHVLPSEPAGRFLHPDSKRHPLGGSDQGGRFELKEVEVAELKDLATLSLSHRNSLVSNNCVVRINGGRASTSKARYLTPDQRNRFESSILKALHDKFGRDEVESVRATQHEPQSLEKLKIYDDFVRNLPLESLIPPRNMENHILLARRKIAEGETTQKVYARENNIDQKDFKEFLTKGGKLTTKGARQVVFGAANRTQGMSRSQVIEELGLQEPLSTALKLRIIGDLRSDIAKHGMRVDDRDMKILSDDQLKSLYEHMDWHDKHFSSGGDTSDLLKGFLNKVYGIKTFIPEPASENGRHDVSSADRRKREKEALWTQLDQVISRMAAEKAEREQIRRKNDLEYELDAKRRAAITAAPEGSGSAFDLPGAEFIAAKATLPKTQRPLASSALERSVPAIEWPGGNSGRAGGNGGNAPAHHAPERNPFEGRFGHLDFHGQRALYRQLALENHPDKPGGDTGRMQHLNAAFAAATRA